MTVSLWRASRRSGEGAPSVLSLFILAVLMLLSMPFTTLAQPDQGSKTVEATGFSAVVGGNVALARDGAVDDALRKAIEQTVGTIVSADTLVENSRVLKDSIYTKTRGYIRGYRITGEGQSGETYQVTVSAEVALGALQDDLDAMGLLHARAGKPRVLFMMAEQAVGKKVFVFWWWGKSEYKGVRTELSASETALKEYFLSKGFNVVDESAAGDTIEISDAMRVVDLTDDSARRIGKKLNAEVVVLGKAIAQEGPRVPGSTVGVYLADATATAINVDTGVVIGAAAGHGTSRHISEVTGSSEALQRASRQMGSSLVDQILARWSSGAMVTLRIANADQKKVTGLREAMARHMRGVAAVYQRRLEGGAAVLDIDTRLGAQGVADALGRLPGVKVRVTGTTQNTVDATLE